MAALAAAPQGTTDSTWAPLARYLEQSVARQAFPGAVVAVGRRDTVLYLRAFGHLSYGGTGQPGDGGTVTERTVYDIASLTKVVGLTSALMMLVDEQKIALDAPVTRYVPEFAAGGDSITVRMLLTHESGLPAWKPFYQTAHGRDDVFAAVLREPLERRPHTQMAYSDLGAIILTRMVENVTGERIDRFLERRLFGPLGMRTTRYRPPRSWLPRIAPTEMDTTWRHRTMRGEVHDENAAAMGGISGHAGLFSTAPDLVRFAQMMLRDATPDEVPAGARASRPARGAPSRLLDASLLSLWTRVQDRAFSSRGLGWDTPSDGSSAGTRLSARAYGHTGFTGTSMWIDPGQDLFVILLTNRVHPTRENRQIFDVRRQVADLAVQIAGAR
jgi:CubicO group peptidase (beta-lactamase class C family)